MKYLLDSVIVIDMLNGSPDATRFVTANTGDCAISVVTLGEVMVKVAPAERDLFEDTAEILRSFPLLTIDWSTALRSARLRQEYRWKLPDAFQAAIALERGLSLVTRNTRDFDPARHGFVTVPYTA